MPPCDRGASYFQGRTHNDSVHSYRKILLVKDIVLELGR